MPEQIGSSGLREGMCVGQAGAPGTSAPRRLHSHWIVEVGGVEGVCFKGRGGRYAVCKRQNPSRNGPNRGPAGGAGSKRVEPGVAITQGALSNATGQAEPHHRSKERLAQLAALGAQVQGGRKPKGGGGDQGRLSACTGGGRGDPHGGSNREEIRVFAYTNSDLTLRLR
jgi:hypothetical protein